MPGLSGVELQGRLIASGHSTPIIFVTACANEMLRRNVLTAGAIDFLIKPFNEDRLIECLNASLKI